MPRASPCVVTPRTQISLMPPILNRRITNSTTAYWLNPASRDGVDYDRNRVDYIPPPRAYAPSLGVYTEYHTHLSRIHEEGFPNLLFGQSLRASGCLSPSVRYPRYVRFCVSRPGNYVLSC